MRSLKTLLILGLMTSLAASALAGNYTSGGTFVVKGPFGTIVDNGGVVCEGTNGDGIGGGCLLFPTGLPSSDDGREQGAFVQVFDGAAGAQVAFQVCIDNNGDGICGGPAQDPVCFDQIFFSHDDEGRFFNPLGPLPTSFLKDCAGGFPGYVVLLCQGVHEARSSAHTHSLTTGSIGLAPFGSGYGTFCGGGDGGIGGPTGEAPDAVAKAYVVN